MNNTSIKKQNKNNLNLFLNDYFNIFISLIVIMVLLASYFIVLYPKFISTKISIQKNIEQQQKLYEQQQKKLNNLKVITEVYKKINVNDLEKFNKAFPDKYAKERLFGEISEIVNNSGFVLSSVELNDREDPDDRQVPEKQDDILQNISPNVGTLEINVSINAINYMGFKNILYIFEKNLRLFDVNKVSFSSNNQSGEISLITYYYKE